MVITVQSETRNSVCPEKRRLNEHPCDVARTRQSTLPAGCSLTTFAHTYHQSWMNQRTVPQLVSHRREIIESCLFRAFMCMCKPVLQTYHFESHDIPLAEQSL